MRDLSEFVRPTEHERALFGSKAGLYCTLRMANVLLFGIGSAFLASRSVVGDVDASPAFGHWPSSRRSLTVVDRTGDPEWERATRWAVDQWNQSGTGLRISWAAGQGACRYAGTAVSICPETSDGLGRFGRLHLQGIADQQRGGDHVSGALVRVCSDCTLSADRRRQVTTHELGHVLGLLHSGRPESVMFASGGSDVPDQLDHEELRRAYRHRDG